MILGDKSMLSEDEMHAGEPFCVQNLFLSQSINNFSLLYDSIMTRVLIGKRKRLDVGLRTSKKKQSAIYLFKLLR